MIAKIILSFLGLLCLTPWIPSPLALALGVACALTLGNPFADLTKKLTPKLLTYCVVGLGAGMNLKVVADVGVQGIAYTITGITLTLGLGYFIGKWLNAESETSLLISVGTAICGGSAIAAVAPVIRARPQAMSVALGTVFLLNSAALLIFPLLGHHFALTQKQFGLWSALAIHDTSSVVGACLQFGADALHTGTTVKLARALWIVPVAIGIGFLFTKEANPQ